MQYNPDSKFLNQLKQNHEEILHFLKENGYDFRDLPIKRDADREKGESYAIAYPIQGMLKYHGMINTEHRIAFFPSISINNDSVFTITYLKLDPQLGNDAFILNGIKQNGNEFTRIKHQINQIRKYSGIKSNFFCVSRNILKGTKIISTGKGLGTSASGGAAISAAAFNILYDDPEFTTNYRLLSIFARYLAGSASRSTVGGFGLWLNHPFMNSDESYAIRLDTDSDSDFVKSIYLVTISLPLKIKTDTVHSIAPNSPFFKSWAEKRKDQIIEFVTALKKHDFNKIGEMIEYDTLCLHSITMTADKSDGLILWSPETLKIMRLTKLLRKKGIPVFYSIDTGPSVVLLTKEKYYEEVVETLSSNIENLEISTGKIGGQSQILNPRSSDSVTNLLKDDIEKFEN